MNLLNPRIAERVHLGVSAVLFLSIVVMLNWLSFRHYERWDWTKQSLYTLSDRTVKELEALEETVELFVFMSEGESSYPDVKELLDRYRARSGKLSVQFVDPDRDPSRYKVLMQRFDVGTAVDLASGEEIADAAVVVSQGERRWTITRDDLVGMDYSSLDDDDGTKVDVKAEQALTGAILQVTSGSRTRICVTQGHGEWTVEDSSRERSLASVEELFRRDNIDLEGLVIRGIDEIPERCTAVFVLGPVKAFSSEEAEALDRYVAGGGNVLLAVDPVVEQERVIDLGFDTVLGRWGVALGRKRRARTRQATPDVTTESGGPLSRHDLRAARRDTSSFGGAFSVAVCARADRAGRRVGASIAPAHHEGQLCHIRHSGSRGGRATVAFERRRGGSSLDRRGHSGRRAFGRKGRQGHCHRRQRLASTRVHPPRVRQHGSFVWTYWVSHAACDARFDRTQKKSRASGSR